jgi:hypothetical protein
MSLWVVISGSDAPELGSSFGSPLYAGMSETQTISISLPAAISPAAVTSA